MNAIATKTARTMRYEQKTKSVRHVTSSAVMTNGTRGARGRERRSRTSSSVTALTLPAIRVRRAHAPPVDLVRLAARDVHAAARARDHVLARRARGHAFVGGRLLHLRAEEPAEDEVDEEGDEEEKEDAGHGAILG